jgi:hypothetical protein
MAMEERQTQIREGAGLEEARINTEFVELLKKFSTPLLVAVAVLAGGYFLYNKRQESRLKSIDESFLQFEAAATSENPTSLLRVADEATSAASAGTMALLTAADMHLESFRTGVPAGAAVDNQGQISTEGMTLLTDEQRQKELKDAEEMYQRVVNANKGDEGMLLQTLAGMSGLAAVAESRGQLDAARSQYQSIAEKARSAGMESVAAMFDSWAKNTEQLKDLPRLYAAKDLASSTAPVTPFTTPLQDVKFKDAQGNEVKMTPSDPPPGAPGSTPGSGVLTPVPAPVPAPTPAPAQPAPAQPDTPKPN